MSQEIVLTQPDDTAVRGEIAPVVINARDLVVANKFGHENAQLVFVAIRKAETKVVELFVDAKRAAHKAHRAICDAENKLLSPLTEAKRIVNSKCTTYEHEERRKAEEKRRELERKQRAEDEDRRLEEAVAAADAGNEELADAILDEPETAIIAHVEPEIAKVKGVSAQVRWHAEVVDFPAFLRFVAESPALHHLVKADGPALNRMATSAKASMNVPGVKAVSETTRAVRG